MCFLQGLLIKRKRRKMGRGRGCFQRLAAPQIDGTAWLCAPLPGGLHRRRCLQIGSLSISAAAAKVVCGFPYLLAPSSLSFTIPPVRLSVHPPLYSLLWSACLRSFFDIYVQEQPFCILFSITI